MGMSPENLAQMQQIGLDQSNTQAPVGPDGQEGYAPTPVEGQMSPEMQDPSMDMGMADQYAQQYQDIPPELLQQLAMQGGDPAAMGMGQQQMEPPDPVTQAMITTFDMYEAVAQRQDLDAKVQADVMYTFAQTVKLFSDVQNVGVEQQQQQGVDPELQFQMEMQKMEMQMQFEQQRMEMETQRLQMELEYKRQEAELKLQLQREQADIKLEVEMNKAQMDMEKKQDEHILSMAQKEDEIDGESARESGGSDM